MKGKILFVAGTAAGYVLGARAGRKRYDQIAASASRLWNTAPVQDVVGTVEGVAKTQLSTVGDAAYGLVKSLVTKTASTATKVTGGSEAEASAAAREAAAKVDEASAAGGSGSSASSTSSSQA